MKFYILCAVLISCKSCICSYIYNAIPRNADVFSPCENQPKNVLDINGAADLSKTHFGYTENGEITCSGNATTIWDIQPNDRISVILDIDFNALAESTKIIIPFFLVCCQCNAL